MNYKILSGAALAALALMMWAACTKPTPFGSELLDDQFASYTESDTLSLRFTVEREDSIISSDRGSSTSYFLCGKLDDPLFGKSESEIFALFKLRSLSPNFANATLDSIVLYLGYGSGGVYGDTLVPQTLKVERLSQKIEPGKTYYSKDSLPVAEEIGSLDNFYPRPTTILKYYPSDSSSTVKAAHIRIPLSAAFGQELLALDSLSRSSDSVFWDRLRGIRITTSAASSPGAILAFTLNDEVHSFVRLYYKRDTTSYVTDFNFTNTNKFLHFTHDYSGTVAGQQIGQPSDQLLYLQGMVGLRLKMEIPYVDRLDNIAINSAQLEMTQASVPGDNAYLAANPASQIAFTKVQGDSAAVFTRDVAYSLDAASSFIRFGGSPKSVTDNGTAVKRYYLTLSQELQRLVDDTSGDIKHKTLYVNVYPQRTSAQRVILYGPGSATFPAKLILKYTHVQ